MHGCFYLHLTKRDQKGNTVPVKEMFSLLFSSVWKMQFVCLRDNWTPDDKVS